MAKEAKMFVPPGKIRPGVFICFALWAEFKIWAKGQGKTLPRAIEDALRGAMIKQQASACIAGDGKVDSNVAI